MDRKILSLPPWRWQLRGETVLGQSSVVSGCELGAELGKDKSASGFGHNLHGLGFYILIFPLAFLA